MTPQEHVSAIGHIERARLEGDADLLASIALALLETAYLESQRWGTLVQTSVANHQLKKAGRWPSHPN